MSTQNQDSCSICLEPLSKDSNIENNMDNELNYLT